MLCFLGWNALTSQSKWQSGLFLGGANYQGDLLEQQAPLMKETGYALGLINRFRFSDHFSARAHFMIGKISGSDLNSEENSGRRNRNFSFNSQIGEFALALEYEPFATRKDSTSSKRLLSPFVYLGIGAYRANPTNTFETRLGNEFLAKINTDQSESTNDIQPMIPLGGGVKFNLSRRFVLGMELGTRIVFDDYLDGVSVSASEEHNDWYWFGGVNVGVRFLPKDVDRDGIADKYDECPEIMGLEATQGCPDADFDGIADQADWCPNSFGDAALNGCPDADGDGIADVFDDCPNSFGEEGTAGCPDSDDDFIADHIDDCPHLAGTIIGKGCPLFDANSDGNLSSELEYRQFPYPNTMKEVVKQQEAFWWIKKPEIWTYFQW